MRISDWSSDVCSSDLYHIFQTSKEEEVMRAMRKGLQAAGIPVENSKGEWGHGQAEINVRYDEALPMADNHVLLKNACKEIASQKGKEITFMAKWNYALAGGTCPSTPPLGDQPGNDKP